MRQFTGSPSSSVENGSKTGSKTGPTLASTLRSTLASASGSRAGSTTGAAVRLDAALLQSLQWSDLPAFDALVNRSDEAEEGWTLHTLSRSLFNWPTAADRALIGLTDHSDGKTVLLGVAGLAPDPRNHHDAHLSILVDPQHCGRGVGEQLLDAIMRIAVARGYGSASARCRPDNSAFVHLMIRHGFALSSHPGTEPILLSRLLDGVRS